MSFDRDGFFSAEMIRFRTSIRTLPECQPWFDFAADLNRFALDLLRDHETPLDDNQLLAISALFVRAHQSFQAALMLAENGMIGDSRTANRSCIEGAIALCALAADPSFVHRLIAAHYKHRLTLAQAELGDPDFRADHSPADIARLEAMVAEIKALETDPKKQQWRPARIDWAAVAKVHCKALYQTLYRPLSADGVHVSIEAINRSLDADKNMRIKMLKVGPDMEDIVETLRVTCLSLVCALEPFMRGFGMIDDPRLSELLKRFQRLPRDEPKLA